MVASELRFGIPDVDLTWSCGGTVNPSCFVGHQLFVLFLPTDDERQAAELTSYDALADAFAGTDAWFLVIGRAETFPLLHRSTPIAFDPDGAAWSAFKKLAQGKLTSERADGAAFLFTRGGALYRVWNGPGHAAELVQELKGRV
jgi:hypothetical protein